MHISPQPPRAAARLISGLRRRGASGPALLAAGVLTLSAAAALADGPESILPNGDFEDLDANLKPTGWQLPAGDGGPGAFIDLHPSEPENRSLRLGSDPSGNNFDTPQVVASASLDVPIQNPGAAHTLVFRCRVARSSVFPGAPGALRFAVDVQTDPIVPTATTTFHCDLGFFLSVPASDTFTPVSIAIDVPPPVFAVQAFHIVQATPGVLHLDDIEFCVLPVPFTAEPRIVDGAGGTPVELNGPALTPLQDVFVDGEPVQVREAQPGRIVFLTPPHQAGLAEVLVADPSGTEQRYSGFLYIVPLTVLQPPDVPPIPVAADGGSAIEIRGSGFVDHTQFILGSDAADIILLEPNRALLSTPPLPVGPVFLDTVDGFGRSFAAPDLIESFRRPIITDVSPDSGPDDGGTPITITGINLDTLTRIEFDGGEGEDVVVIDPNQAQVTTPPGDRGAVPVAGISAQGLRGELPNGFEYQAPVLGDLNGDLILDLRDVMGSVLIATGDGSAAIDFEIRTDGDVNGDGRIGLKDAVHALQRIHLPEPNSLAAIPAPTIEFVNPEAAGDSLTLPFGVSALVEASFSDHLLPVVIDWGDGFSAVVLPDDTVAHVYDRPSAYDVTIRSEAGVHGSLHVNHLPPPKPSVHSIQLELIGTDDSGAPLQGRFGNVAPGSNVSISITVTASAPQESALHGSLIFDAPLPAGRSSLPVEILLPASQGPEPSSMIVPFSPNAEGEYFVYYEPERSSVSNIAPQAANPLPVTIHVPASELEENCKEIERIWRIKVAEKEAKKRDCDALEEQLKDCQDRRAALQNQRDAKQNQRDAKEAERDSKQTAFDALFASVDAFLSGAGDLIHYTDGSEIPANSQFVGARKGGASGGIGVAFASAEAAIARNNLYQQTHGHSIGKDLNTLRECIKTLDKLESEIDSLDADIAALDAQIAALDAAIAAKQAALSACKQECANLEQEIEDLEDQRRDCLEELEQQRMAEKEAESDIRGAENKGGSVSGESDRTHREADSADDDIDGRAGTPGQTANDKDEVQTGRSCADVADNLIAQGEQKLQQARAALAQGDTETAKQLAAEAQGLFAQADAKLDEARDHIRTGRTSALGRKRRQCTDGEIRTGPTVNTKVWTELVDVGTAPQGTSRQKWTRQQENADGVLDGIRNLLKLVDFFGDASPIGGPVTPDADRAAEAIVNAHLELFEQRFPFDVWVHVRGHTEWKRTDAICINGCWESSTVEGSLDDNCEAELNIGTIWGGDKESRKEKLRDILDNFLKSHASLKK